MPGSRTLNNINSGLSLIESPYGFTYRSFGASWANAGNMAKEDWIRNEQAQTNQMYRDLYVQDHANAFNASEAEKQRAYETEMSNTAYQRAVADMKKAGINPIMAYSGSASTPSVGFASASPSRSSSGYRANDYSSSDGAIVSGVMNILAGLLLKNPKGAIKEVSKVINIIK